MAVRLHGMIDQGGAVSYPSPVAQLEDLSCPIPPVENTHVCLQTASKPSITGCPHNIVQYKGRPRKNRSWYSPQLSEGMTGRGGLFGP
jgi:hypothetical protein